MGCLSFSNVQGSECEGTRKMCKLINQTWIFIIWMKLFDRMARGQLSISHRLFDESNWLWPGLMATVLKFKFTGNY